MNDADKKTLERFFLCLVIFWFGMVTGHFIDEGYAQREAKEQNVFTHVIMFGNGFRSESEIKFCEQIENVHVKMECLGFKAGDQR